MSDVGHPSDTALGSHRDSAAENLLFTQYRCWMAGYSTRDISCWEIAWTVLAGRTGADAARGLYGEFHCFVRTILETARRDVGWRPAACRCLCRDEAVVLALLEASQQARGDREADMANDLLGHHDSAPLLEASRSLARSLAAQGLWLKPPSLADSAATAPQRLH